MKQPRKDLVDLLERVLICKGATLEQDAFQLYMEVKRALRLENEKQ